MTIVKKSFVNKEPDKEVLGKTYYMLKKIRLVGEYFNQLSHISFENPIPIVKIFLSRNWQGY